MPGKKLYYLVSEENGNPLLVSNNGYRFFGPLEVYKTCRIMTFSKKAEADRMARGWYASVREMKG